MARQIFKEIIKYEENFEKNHVHSQEVRIIVVMKRKSYLTKLEFSEHEQGG